jgi:hypothetical protein
MFVLSFGCLAGLLFTDNSRPETGMVPEHRGQYLAGVWCGHERAKRWRVPAPHTRSCTGLEPRA